jgi:hypothetical protein
MKKLSPDDSKVAHIAGLLQCPNDALQNTAQIFIVAFS